MKEAGFQIPPDSPEAGSVLGFTRDWASYVVGKELLKADEWAEAVTQALSQEHHVEFSGSAKLLEQGKSYTLGWWLAKIFYNIWKYLMARKTVFGLVFVALIAVTAVLINRAQQDYSWENPITRLDAKIDSRWKHSTELVDGGVQAHLFTEPTDRAMVSLLMENGPGYTLHDYVLGVKMGFAARGLFVDDGRFEEMDARPGRGRGAWSKKMLVSASMLRSSKLVRYFGKLERFKIAPMINLMRSWLNSVLHFGAQLSSPAIVMQITDHSSGSAKATFLYPPNLHVVLHFKLKSSSSSAR